MPLLSLEAFRTIAAYNPLYWWGIYKTPQAMQGSQCLAIVRQYAWQGYQSVGRREIEEAIDQAECIAQRYLQYSPAARYVVLDDVVINDVRRGLIKLPNESYIQCLGERTVTVLGAPTLSYSDSDGDGVLDTFTATLPTALTTDPLDSLHVVIPQSQRITMQRRDWSIKPIQISTALNGLTYDVTITGKSWLCVLPLKYEGFTPDPKDGLDPNNLTNYLTTLQIEQHTYDQDRTIELIHPDGASTFHPARIADAKHGIIAFGGDCSWFQAYCTTWRMKPRAKIHGVFGYPIGSDRDMSEQWQQTIAILAATQLPQAPCPCKEANQWMDYYTEDMALMDANAGTMYRKADKTNPLGTKRGHGIVFDLLCEEQHIKSITL